jgi:transposase
MKLKMKAGRPPVKVALDPETRERLEAVYRTSPLPKDRQRAQAVLLASEGERTYEELGRIVLRSGRTVFNWFKALAEGGVEGLLASAPRPGRPSAMHGARVAEEMNRGLDEGRWVTSGHVREWLASEMGVSLSGRAVRYWLEKLGGAHKMPRPAHVKRDDTLAGSFKGHFLEELAALPIPRGARIRVWAADEARFGLRDGLRRCWCRRGRTAVKRMQMEYEWGYLYGALDVVGGAAEFRVMPTVGLGLTLGFLRQIAGSDPDAQHIVVWDNAGFHQPPGDASLPPNVHLLPLPPYSPELNPAEKAWEFIRDRIGNRVYGVIGAMEDAVCAAARELIASPQKILGLVGDGWMHVQANAM